MSLSEVEALAAELVARDPTHRIRRAGPHHAQDVDAERPALQRAVALLRTTGGLRLPTAWDKPTGTGVNVAVIDTGYRPHADLSGQILAGYDFICTATIANDGNGRDSDASDTGRRDRGRRVRRRPADQRSSSSWHGTHVAGTIAAQDQQRASASPAWPTTPRSCRCACSASAAATPPTSPTRSSGRRAAPSAACRPTPIRRA